MRETSQGSTVTGTSLVSLCASGARSTRISALSGCGHRVRRRSHPDAPAVPGLGRVDAGCAAAGTAERSGSWPARADQQTWQQPLRGRLLSPERPPAFHGRGRLSFPLGSPRPPLLPRQEPTCGTTGTTISESPDARRRRQLVGGMPVAVAPTLAVVADQAMMALWTIGLGPASGRPTSALLLSPAVTKRAERRRILTAEMRCFLTQMPHGAAGPV